MKYNFLVIENDKVTFKQFHLSPTSSITSATETINDKLFNTFALTIPSDGLYLLPGDRFQLSNLITPNNEDMVAEAAISMLTTNEDGVHFIALRNAIDMEYFVPEFVLEIEDNIETFEIVEDQVQEPTNLIETIENLDDSTTHFIDACAVKRVNKAPKMNHAKRKAGLLILFLVIVAVSISLSLYFLVFNKKTHSRDNNGIKEEQSDGNGPKAGPKDVTPISTKPVLKPVDRQPNIINPTQDISNSFPLQNQPVKVFQSPVIQQPVQVIHPPVIQQPVQVIQAQQIPPFQQNLPVWRNQRPPIHHHKSQVHHHHQRRPRF